MHARCSASAEMTAKLMTYLICFDGSQHAEAAVRYVAAHARGGSKVILFCGYPRGALRPLRCLRRTSRSLMCAACAGELAVVPAPPVAYEGAVFMPDADSSEWVKLEKTRRAQATSRVVLDGKRQLLACTDNLIRDEDVRELVAETGDVRETVLDIAMRENADAIVVGCRGRGTLKRLVLGSTSYYLTNHAQVPVIVARSSSASN